MTGTRAPSTMPAASASARKERLFASMLPASRSGTTSTFARPATGYIFLIAAAPALIALSSASGLSRSAPRAGAHSVADVHQTPADVVTVAVVSSAIHPAAVVVAVTGAVIWIPIPITIVGIRGGRAEERASRQTPPPPVISADAPPPAHIVPAIPAAIAAIAPARVSPTAAIAAAMPTAAPAAAAEAAHAAVKAPETA